MITVAIDTSMHISAKDLDEFIIEIMHVLMHRMHYTWEAGA